MSDFNPDKKPWRERIGDAKRFVNDHPVECAYVAGSVTGAAIATVMVKDMKIRGVKQIFDNLIGEIKLSHLETAHAQELASNLAEFIDIKDLGAEYLKMFGTPKPIIVT